MLIKHAHDVAAEAPQMQGAGGVTLQWLISDNDGAKNYAMRIFTVVPDGVIPVHVHEDTEHEIFVVEGEGIFSDGDKEYAIKENDVVFVPPGEKHGIVNHSERPLKFICVIPIKKQ